MCSLVTGKMTSREIVGTRSKAARSQVYFLPVLDPVRLRGLCDAPGIVCRMNSWWFQVSVQCFFFNFQWICKKWFWFLSPVPYFSGYQRIPTGTSNLSISCPKGFEISAPALRVFFCAQPLCDKSKMNNFSHQNCPKLQKYIAAILESKKGLTVTL